MKTTKKLLSLLLVFLMAAGLLGGCSASDAAELMQLASDVADLVGEIPTVDSSGDVTALPDTEIPDPDKSYTTAEDVARYLIHYGQLPVNFITKDEARSAGWEGGSLEPFCPGKCIGGDRFGNREGLLPDAEGRRWTECDINTLGAESRGAERLVFSNDGLIYYTDDHYGSFTLLHGTP